MTVNRTMGAAQWALLCTLSILWGGSFFFIDVALRALPPLCVAAWRVAAGAALLYACLLYTSPSPRDS